MQVSSDDDTEDEDGKEALQERQDETQGDQKGNKSKQSTALTLHLATGKKFVIKSFQNTNLTLPADKCQEMFHQLEGTDWQFDPDVLCHRLGSGTTAKGTQGNEAFE
mgnify:CR=1 FL=1